jgi:hypothetical protein
MSFMTQSPLALAAVASPVGSVSLPLCPFVRMSALPITDRLVVSAIRAWVEVVRNDLPPSGAAQAAFGAVGMADVASLIHALMTAVAYGARRPLEIARPCAGRLTDDESLILDAIALGRPNIGVDPTPALRPLLNPPACRAARHLCAELAEVLAQAGASLDGRLERLGRRMRPTCISAAGDSTAGDGAGAFLQAVEHGVEQGHVVVA